MKSISGEDIETPHGPPNLRYLTVAEGRELFDHQAKRYFGMSGEEFIQAWKAGELDEHPNQTDVEYVAMMISFVEHALA